MQNHQSNFNDFLRSKQPFARTSSNQFFEKFESAFKEMMYSFPEDNRPTYKAVHLEPSSIGLTTISMAVIHWAIEGHSYFAVFFPLVPGGMSFLLHNQIQEHLRETIHNGANRKYIHQAFGVAEDVVSTIATLIYQPTDIDNVTDKHLAKLIPNMCRRILAAASVDQVLEAEKPSDEMLTTVFCAEDMRDVQLINSHVFHAEPITDMFGHAIRNDVTLMLSAKQRRHRRTSMSFEQEVKVDETALLRVSGYIDFRPTQASKNRRQPWVEVDQKYVPEFIITDVGYPDGLLSLALIDLQAAGMAIVMVRQFMESGDWHRLFVPSFRSGAGDDLVFLVEPSKGTPKNVKTTLQDVVDPGYVLSADVPGNPTSDYDLGIIAAAVDSHFSKDTLLGVFGALLANNKDYVAQHAQVMFNNIGSYAPADMQLGQLSYDERLPHLDLREIDTLGLLKLLPEHQRELAGKFQQSMLSIPDNQSSMQDRAKIIQCIEPKPKTLVYDVARRVMLNHETVSWFAQVTAQVGLNVEYQAAEEKRTGVNQMFINS